MSFEPFTRDHLITVATGAAVVAVLLMTGKRGGKSRLLATALLAFVNLAAYASQPGGVADAGRTCSRWTTSCRSTCATSPR